MCFVYQRQTYQQRAHAAHARLRQQHHQTRGNNIGAGGSGVISNNAARRMA